MWRESIDARVIAKRAAAACTPLYAPSGLCTGDCREAWLPLTQTNAATCPGYPTTSSQSCAAGLPCACFLSQLTLGPGVVTCGNCDVVTEGQSCYFVCADPAQTLTSNSSNHAVCLTTGWASFSIPPTCSTPPRVCPPLVSAGGLNLNMDPAQSVCVGATDSQVCRAQCFPLFYNPAGQYTATCTCPVDAPCTWSNRLWCECQNCPLDIPGCPSTPQFINTAVV